MHDGTSHTLQTNGDVTLGAAPSADEIEAQLQRILESPVFRGARVIAGFWLSLFARRWQARPIRSRSTRSVWRSLIARRTSIPRPTP